MKKIAVVTATRAEYGILRPLICRLQKDTEFELQLIVTGMHLSEKYGNTQVEIEKDKSLFLEKSPFLKTETVRMMFQLQWQMHFAELQDISGTKNRTW